GRGTCSFKYHCRAETESERAARLAPEPKRPRGHAQVKSLNQGSPGNRGKGNGVKVSNGSSQSARKNTATVRTEPIASSTISSLSRSRLMQRQRREKRLIRLSLAGVCAEYS